MSLNSEMRDWQRVGGVSFLKEMGVKGGDVVVDFGCRVGHYSIPGGKVVGEGGKVYAIDKDRHSLTKLKRRAKQEGLDNVEIVHSDGGFLADLGDVCVDVVLVYDVLHLIEEREELYKEFRRILKKGGLLLVYPTHYKGKHGRRHFKNMEVSEILKEIEEGGFVFEDEYLRRISHYNHLKEDTVYVYRRA